MGRSPCCDEQSGLKKGPWTTEEDQMLVDYISKNGHGSWRVLPKLAGLNRCGKSCRLRWINYLRPDIKQGKFSEDEERVIINLHEVVGNKVESWVVLTKIATHLPGRTDDEIKNYWNTHLRKKLLQMGLDPKTHRPRSDLNHLLNLSQLLSLASVRDMVTTNPWDNALRLQAGAAQLEKMQLLQNLYMKAMNSSLVNHGIDNKASIGNFGYQNTNFNGASSVGDMEQEWNVDSIPGKTTEMNNISMTMEGFEGLNRNMNNLSHCYGLQKQHQELVTSSPGSSTTNNRMEATTSTSDIPDACQSSPSSIFEIWEKLMDDDTSESYWKNILQSMS